MNAKKYAKAICLLIILACVNACDTKLANHASAPAAPSPSNSYGLSEQELKANLELAQSGNVESMNKLANFYLIYNDEPTRGFYWLERAGDAGDLKAREFLLGHYAAQDAEEKKSYGSALRKRWASEK